VFDLPLFPDVSGQRETRFQRRFAGLPSRGRDFAGFYDMLEGHKLPEELVDISAHFGSQNFCTANDAVRVDDESSADVNSGAGIVDAVDFADCTTSIREHRERYAAFDDFREFLFLPNFVRESAVRADGQDLHADCFQILVLDCDRSQLRRSNKCEVAGIEAEHDPLPQILRKFDIFERSVHQSTGFEIRSL
jgi:hypothetical protein